jgi:hypothetical protein
MSRVRSQLGATRNQMMPGASNPALGSTATHNPTHLVAACLAYSESGSPNSAGSPRASGDMSVFREEPQLSIGEPVDLLDPETIASIAAVVSRLR